MMHSLLIIAGIIGNIGFGIGSVQLAWATLKAGKATVPVDTAWTYLIACVAFGMFLVGSFGWNWLFGVMLVETVAWVLVVWYHFFPRKLRWCNRLECCPGTVPRGALECTNGHRQDELPVRMGMNRDGDWGPALYQPPLCPHGFKDWDDCPVCCH